MKQRKSIFYKILVIILLVNIDLRCKHIHTDYLSDVSIAERLIFDMCMMENYCGGIIVRHDRAFYIV